MQHFKTNILIDFQLQPRKKVPTANPWPRLLVSMVHWLDYWASNHGDTLFLQQRPFTIILLYGHQS